MSMDLPSLALKKMLSQRDVAKQTALLSMLSHHIRANYETAPKVGVITTNYTLLEQLAKIHPSHFIEAMRHLGSEDRHYYISPLPKPSQEFLTNHFKDSFSPYNLPPRLNQLAAEQLLEITFGKEKPIPLSFLPDEKLSFLAKATHKDLLTLCQNLGLFDVVIEIRKIIQSALLKQLETAFTLEELTFLRDIHNYQKGVQLGEMGLKNFTGNRAELRDIILNRGLHRLSLALFGSSKYLLWHILHIFSLDEAAKLKGFQTKAKSTASPDFFIDQVIFTWDKRCTHSH